MHTPARGGLRLTAAHCVHTFPCRFLCSLQPGLWPLHVRLQVASLTLRAVLALSDTGAAHFDIKPANLIMQLANLGDNWGERELQATPANQLSCLLRGLEAALGDNNDTVLPAGAGDTSRTGDTTSAGGKGTVAYFTPVQWATQLRRRLVWYDRNRVRCHGTHTARTCFPAASQYPCVVTSMPVSVPAADTNCDGLPTAV